MVLEAALNLRPLARPLVPSRSSWFPVEVFVPAVLTLLVSVFLACTVEAVEALTVVLAIGVTRGWRASSYGVGAGLGVLAVIVAVLGPALAAVPLNGLRLVVGALLLVFGLQWLRKAVLRAAGRKAVHDEAALFRAQRQAAEATERSGGGFDGYAFTLCFKAVLLEGLEVVFIVLTFGANAARVPLAALAAIAAVVLVTVVGFVVHGPLARVPENQLKFVVGVMLTAFGMFWSGEGAGVDWPGADAALPVLALATAALALVLVAALRVPARQGVAA
jgi:uncharacterized membrane protein